MKRFKFKINTKLVLIFSIFFMVLFTSFGYAALNTTLTFSGNAGIIADNVLKIIGLKVLSVENGGLEKYNHDFTNDTTTVSAQLPNANSKVVYEVNLYNQSNKKYVYDKYLKMSSNNDNVNITISGLDEANIISPTDNIKFTVTLATTSANQNIDLILKYLFNEYDPNASSETLDTIGETENPGESEPDFNETSVIDETLDGLYKAEDDFGTSYYYRGNVVNNYVKFAGFYWRIIRVNGDGSLRIIYDGTTAHDNGVASTDRYISTGQWNTEVNDNKYVHYVYPSSGTTPNTSSNAKTVVDNWYKANIYDKGYDYFVADTIFCNDSSIISGTGSGTNETIYGAFDRLETNKNPSLKCSNKSDRYTVENKIGNEYLTYKVGLITSDEVVYAGGKTWEGYQNENNNTDFYLNIGQSFWTMTPIEYLDGARVNYVYYAGHIGEWFTINNGAFRPVINLTKEYTALFTGDGTKNSPYQGSGVVANMENTLNVLKKTTRTGTPNFRTSATTDETKTSLYGASDNFGTSYYYRGAVTDNYVKFAGFYWRIIRVNGDGSLRIIYDGTKAHDNGEKSLDRLISPVSKFNSSISDTKFVGYMYGGAESDSSTSYNMAVQNDTDSIIKVYLENWYLNNIENKGFSKYVSDAGFCNDRGLTSGSGYNDGSTTFYNPRTRIYENSAPQFTCTNNNDNFTVRDNVYGNTKQKYPIGLLTADDAMFAGTRYNVANTSYYLYSGYPYYTMSPYHTYRRALGIFAILDNGAVRNVYNTDENYVKPVINIKKEAMLNASGTGTKTDPFVFN